VCPSRRSWLWASCCSYRSSGLSEGPTGHAP
jgi:hypothetical protein